MQMKVTKFTIYSKVVYPLCIEKLRRLLFIGKFAYIVLARGYLYEEMTFTNSEYAMSGCISKLDIWYRYLYVVVVV